jgi:hypothetical protein
VDTVSLDERERDLERRARQGDPDALAAVQRSRRRTARCAGTVHDAEDHMTDDDRRLANAHDVAADRNPWLLGLLKKCDVCGALVRLRGRDR